MSILVLQIYIPEPRPWPVLMTPQLLPLLVVPARSYGPLLLPVCVCVCVCVCMCVYVCVCACV